VIRPNIWSLGQPDQPLQDEDVSAKEYLDWARKLKGRGTGDETRRHAEAAKIYAKYQELKIEKGFVDFADQVSLTLKLFKKNKAVLKKVPAAL